MRIKLLLISLLVFSLQATSQDLSLDFNPEAIPSPNAASLGVFGEIPVDYHTGIPNISIPLHTISEGNLTVPIALKYHASGFKPSQYPSWVGLGWTLQAGGAITRVVKGLSDEHNNHSVESDDSTYNYGYYYNTSELSGEDWFDVYDFTKIIDTEPDEFSFNVNGITGKFYLGHDGKWQVFSEQEIKVVLDPSHIVPINHNHYNPNTQDQDDLYDLGSGQMFYCFTLVGPDGTQYVFGGNRNSIEFTRAERPDIDSKPKKVAPIATTWNLTKIVSADGISTIIFEYERGPEDMVLYVIDSYNIYDFKLDGYSDQLDEYPVSHTKIVEPSYLKTITSKYQKIVFSSSQSNALPLSMPANFISNGLDNNYLKNYQDMKYKTLADGFYLCNNQTLSKVGRKLNSITVENLIGAIFKRYNFSYDENSSYRLKLKSLNENISTIENIHSFEYYPFPTNAEVPGISVPNYYSKRIDHWGYFSNNEYSLSGIDYENFLSNQDELKSYFNSRNASTNDKIYLANTLKKITYPTGGYTVFEYEQNDYSEYIDREPDLFNSQIIGILGLDVMKLSDKPKAGGLRIKKIVSYNNIPGNELSKEYFYINNYEVGDDNSSIQSKLSSGQLQTELPQESDLLNSAIDIISPYNKKGSYYKNDTDVGDFHIFSVNPVIPLINSSGNHVVYRNVIEKQSDGSYSKYSFLLPDQGSNDYHDNLMLTSINNTYYSEYTSKANERGKLEEEQFYDNEGEIVKKVQYSYNSDPLRYNKGVRTKSSYVQLVTSQQFGDANYIYYFNSYLENKIVTNYANGNAVSENTQYTHGGLNDKLIHEINVVNSDGTELITKYKYTTDYAIDDYINSDYATRYQECLTRYNDCIQEVTECEDACFAQYHTNEDRYNECVAGCMTTADCDFYFNCSDVTYEPNEFTGQTEALKNMQDMHIIEPVEKIVIRKDGDDEKVIEGKLFTYKNYHDKVNKPEKLFSLEPRYPFYTSSSFTESSVNSTGKFCYSYYYEEDVSFNQYDSYGNLLEYQKRYDVPVTYLYGYNGLFPIAKISGLSYTQVISDIENANIDVSDVSTNPEVFNVFSEAIVETYSYNVMDGIKSITNPTALTTYFEYDPMSRLNLVRDHRDNMLEYNVYHYKGQVLGDDVLQYLVSAKTDYNGVIEPSDLVVNEGENTTLSITPNEGYKINSITVNDISQEITSTLNLNDITESKDIVVEFKFDPVTITKTGSGSVTLDPSCTLEVGNDLTYHFTPSETYNVRTLIIDGNPITGYKSSYTFPSVAESHTIDVEFSNLWKISTLVTSEGGGTVTASNFPIFSEYECIITQEYTEIEYGGSLSVLVEADEGYYIEEIVVDEFPVEGLTETTTSHVVALDNITNSGGVDASFKIKTYDITTTVTGNGTISPSGPETVDYGSSRAYTITPAANHHIKSVKVNGVSQGTSGILTIPDIKEDKDIEVVFELDCFPITITKEGSGTLSHTGVVNVNYGENFTLSVTPANCYNVKNITLDEQTFAQPYTINNVTGPHDIHVVFSNMWKINTIVTSGSGGTITASPFPVLSEYECVIYPEYTEIECGGGLSILVQADEGYYIEEIVVDEFPVDGLTETTTSHTVELENITNHGGVDATFKIKTFEVTATSGANGSISSAGTSTFNYGSSKTYNFTPNTGYHVSNVIVDGVSQGAITSYTFPSIDDNHTIHVEFAVNLSISKQYLSFTSTGGSTSFSITSNSSWTITTENSWLTISPTSGSNNATITVNCGGFMFGDRYGEITITGGGVTETILVTQSDGND